MKRFLLLFFWIYLVAYALLLLLNLDKIPLVWFDEVMGLDPAVNLVFKDGFRSMIWPQTGTEDRFMAYLPLRFMFHSLHLSTLPLEVFWQRIPWAVYFILSVFFIAWSVRTQHADWRIILLVAFVLINDKTVFEVARSMRVDPLSLLFIALTALAFFKKKFVLQGVLSSIIVFIHPNLWPFALILFVDAYMKVNKVNKRKALLPNLLWLIPILFTTLYLWSIDMRVDMWYTQMFEHGSKHSAAGGILERLEAHFIDRFWPYYNTQVYIPLIIYFGLFASIFRLVKKKGSSLDVALVCTHLFWLVVLAPFYRYNAVLMYLTALTLIPHIPKLKENTYAIGLLVLFILVHPANVMARHAMAITQSNERDPKPVLSWLKSELNNEKVLLFGHDIAYYAVAKDREKDYMMFNLLPPKHSFEDYQKVLVLTTDSLHIDGVVQLSRYSSKETNSPSILKEVFMSKPTYAKLYLSEVKNQKAFYKCLSYLDSENVSVNRP